MSDAMRQQLTILVPTYNRYDRLLRLLRYYHATGCAAPLHVLDSSREALPAQGELRALLTRQGSLVSHTRYPPDIEALAKILSGLQDVTTPYVVLWADDDFLVPGTLEDGVRVLSQHPDVSVVHGQSALFRLQAGRVQWVAPYLQRSVLDETASARLKDHFQRYFVTFYSVHRTEQLVKNFQQVCQTGLDWHTWGELALSALAILQGKALALPRLYMVREGHAGMGSRTVQQQRGLDHFDWLTDTACTRQHGTYEMFRECLVPELMARDGLEASQARDVVKQALWPYFVRGMEEKWSTEDGRNVVPFGVRFREAAKRVPGLRTAWRTARAWMPHRPSTISLDALRQPSSRYYRDFMPIYRAVTTNGECG